MSTRWLLDAMFELLQSAQIRLCSCFLVAILKRFNELAFSNVTAMFRNEGANGVDWVFLVGIPFSLSSSFVTFCKEWLGQQTWIANTDELDGGTRQWRAWPLFERYLDISMPFFPSEYRSELKILSSSQMINNKARPDMTSSGAYCC